MRGAPQERVIKDLNPTNRGWSQYYSSVVSCKIFSSLDNIMHRKLWRWAVFRHPNKGRGWIKRKYFKKIDFAYKTIGEKDLVAFIDLNSGSIKTLDRTAVGVFQPFFMKSDFSYEPKRCGVWVDLLAAKLNPATVEHDIHKFLRKYEHRLHAIVVEEQV